MIENCKIVTKKIEVLAENYAHKCYNHACAWISPHRASKQCPNKKIGFMP